ncbi:MAG: hypothetical protein H6973_04635 [Gammaproteobacteria bacterium]|nr:hypothetical protein [Gammaproteobacteria bacterium]
MKKLPSRPLPNALNQSVSAPALLNQARQAFEKIPDPCRYGHRLANDYPYIINELSVNQIV